jgi:hypothetical protein
MVLLLTCCCWQCQAAIYEEATNEAEEDARDLKGSAKLLFIET